MKVILLTDVPKIGRKFEIKDVADGYAMNALLPKGLAKLATPDAVAKIEAEKKQHDAEVSLQSELVAKTLKGLDGKVITITEKVNDQGHLFHGLHEADIAAAIKKDAQVEIEHTMVKLDAPIKEAGDHQITLQNEGTKATITLRIEA